MPLLDVTSPLNIVDPILLVLLALFALRGYFKGFFREAFSLLGLFAGLMLAVRYEQPLAEFWAESWKTSFIFLRAASFVALFFLTYFSLNLIGWLLHRSAGLLFLQGANRIGGVVLGAGKGAAIMALAIFFLTSTPLVSRNAKKNIGHSYLVPIFNQLAAELVHLSRAALLEPEESRAGERERL